MKKRYLIPIITLLIVGGLIAGCIILTNPMQGESEKVVFKVEQNELPKTTIKRLKKEGLIRSDLFTYIYARINKKTNIGHGYFELDKSDSLKEIMRILNDPSEAKDIDSKEIRFNEGSTVEDFANKIALAYGLEKEQVIAKIDDKEFVQSLIDNKDLEIVTSDVLKDGIRHPLEGYLYADTYYFAKDASVEDIVKILVRTMNDKYKTSVKKTSYELVNYHDLLTLASMVELEGPSRTATNYKDELQGVAEVFVNRLVAGMTMGSDVTTYYSVKKKIGVDSLYMSDFNKCDGYNTRGTCVKGLPIGPIASPSYDAIEASMKGIVSPKYKEYYYFVADKNTNIHFSKSSDEQNKVIQSLRNQGLWLED